MLEIELIIQKINPISIANPNPPFKYNIGERKTLLISPTSGNTTIIPTKLPIHFVAKVPWPKDRIYAPIPWNTLPIIIIIKENDECKGVYIKSKNWPKASRSEAGISILGPKVS